LYTTDKQRRDKKLNEDKQEIEARVLNRVSAFFPYMEHLRDKWLSILCCCFKCTDWYKHRKRKYAGHQEAFNRLGQEIDILNLIKTNRQTKLLTSVMLRSHQRQLVQYFKNYHIDYDDLQAPERREYKSIDHLLKKFDPDTNSVDKRILNEIMDQAPNERRSDLSGDSSDAENFDT
jgi:hypothetical protein